ncbi:MAG: hypothetical protein MJY60_08025 [Bacteroidales bacterium]|nr:hypothetical protein [Bacteroidales bacterium]
MQNDNKSIEELKAEVESSNSLEEYNRQLFKQLLEVSDVASLPVDEKLNYYARLKIARDNAGCLEVAERQGAKKIKGGGVIRLNPPTTSDIPGS